MDSWPVDDPRRTEILLRRDLIAQGWNDRAIARLVHSGALARARYGSYVDAAAWAACDELGRHAVRTRAVLRRAQSEVVASHLSAAVEWDIPFFDLVPDAVHVTRLDTRAGRREAGVIQHLGRLPDDHVQARNGIMVTSPARTVLDCAALLGSEQAVVMIGDVLHRALATRDDLHAMARVMCRWPGTLRKNTVIDLADGRCESVGEHRSLHLCWHQGLPRPVPQHEVRDHRGIVVARLDFAWPEHGVWLEFDGESKYRALLRDGEDATAVVLREKKRERLIEDLTGWRCVRITWADLYRPQRTAAMIRDLLFPATPIAG